MLNEASNKDQGEAIEMGGGTNRRANKEDKKGLSRLKGVRWCGGGDGSRVRVSSVGISSGSKSGTYGFGLYFAK